MSNYQTYVTSMESMVNANPQGFIMGSYGPFGDSKTVPMMGGWPPVDGSFPGHMPMFHPGFAPVSTIPALPAAAAKKPAVMTEKMRAAIEKEKVRNRKNAAQQRIKRKTALQESQDEIKRLRDELTTINETISDFRQKLLKYETAEETAADIAAALSRKKAGLAGSGETK